jgi:hypothetical protein
MALACAGGGWDSGDSGASADQCANAVPLGTTVQGVDVGWHWDNSIEGYRSDTVALDVPADMFSLAVTMDAGNTDVAWSLVATPTTDWVRIERDDWGGPPFKPSLGAAATLVLPNAENTWPEAGCLRVQAVSVDEIGTSTLWFGGRTQEANTIDINAYIVGDTVVYEDELIAAFTVMFDLYIEGNGPAIGNINLYEVPANAIVSPGGEDMKELMKWTEGTGDPRALDLFFIADFTESGILGIASGLPGAILVDGTAGSGVVIAVDSHLDGSGQVVDTDLMGETMAHEVGHQLGLFHLTESQGDDFDPIADTPECPANQDDNNDGIVDADECMALGGDNFMFWGAGDVRQTDVSSTQSDVLYFSPVVK